VRKVRPCSTRAFAAPPAERVPRSEAIDLPRHEPRPAQFLDGCEVEIQPFKKAAAFPVDAIGGPQGQGGVQKPALQGHRGCFGGHLRPPDAGAI
jgi:hypothetical protein